MSFSSCCACSVNSCDFFIGVSFILQKLGNKDVNNSRHRTACRTYGTRFRGSGSGLPRSLLEKRFDNRPNHVQKKERNNVDE